MSVVRVTFLLEGDDDEDRTGLSEDQFIELNEQISAIGGYDLETERES